MKTVRQMNRPVTSANINMWEALAVEEGLGAFGIDDNGYMRFHPARAEGGEPLSLVALVHAALMRLSHGLDDAAVRRIREYPFDHAVEAFLMPGKRPRPESSRRSKSLVDFAIQLAKKRVEMVAAAVASQLEEFNVDSYRGYIPSTSKAEREIKADVIRAYNSMADHLREQAAEYQRDAA